VIKLLAVFKPVPGKTRDECLAHYRYEHSRVCASAPEFSRHMAKYVQNYVIGGSGPRRALTTEWAGVTQVWFYNEDDYKTAFAEPSYGVLLEDEERFANLNELLRVAAAPSLVFGFCTDTPVKFFTFASFREESDRSSGRNFWEARYAAAVARDERLRRVVTSYVQNRQTGFSIPTSANCDIADEFCIEHVDRLPEFLAAERALRERLEYARVVDTEHQIEVVAESKVMWDLGEDPLLGLTRIGRWQ